MADIRIGKISKIDYKSGMVKVVYEDRDDAVTDLMPVLTFNAEYKMPQLEERVLVVQLSNNDTACVCLGSLWDQDNKPQSQGKGIYLKEYGEIPAEAYESYNSNTGELTIKADKIIFESAAGRISLADIINR